MKSELIDVGLSSGGNLTRRLLYAAHQILAELAEKFKADTKNGLSGQLASDSNIQGITASTVIGLLIACEISQK